MLHSTYFRFLLSILLAETCFCNSEGIAKPMRHEVTNEASQKLFVGERGMATLFYEYRGNNTVAAFTWQTLSPETTIATLTTIVSSALPPYSVAGNVSLAYRTDLIIKSVTASLDGKVYRCFVDFSPASTPRVFSGQVTLTLRDVPELSVLSPSGENVIVNISKPFVIRINVTQGDGVVNVNLTKDGDLVSNGTRKLFEYNISNVSVSTNGTYVAIGDNEVGYHQVQFSLLAFYLGNAECSVVANSMIRGTVTCTIKSFPPVEKATYSCGNQSVELTWKETGSADVLGVPKYQAEAMIMNVSRFIGKSCSLITANRHGQFNETFREVLLSTPTPSPPPTTEGPTTKRMSILSTPASNATPSSITPAPSGNTIAIIVGCVAGGVALIALLLLLLCPINLSCRRCLQRKCCSCCFKCYDDCCGTQDDCENPNKSNATCCAGSYKCSLCCFKCCNDSSGSDEADGHKKGSVPLGEIEEAEPYATSPGAPAAASSSKNDEVEPYGVSGGAVSDTKEKKSKAAPKSVPKEEYAQPDVSKKSKKAAQQAPTGGDVYAQVDKKKKAEKSDLTYADLDHGGSKSATLQSASNEGGVVYSQLQKK